MFYSFCADTWEDTFLGAFLVLKTLPRLHRVLSQNFPELSQTHPCHFHAQSLGCKFLGQAALKPGLVFQTCLHCADIAETNQDFYCSICTARCIKQNCSFPKYPKAVPEPPKGCRSSHRALPNLPRLLPKRCSQGRQHG